MAFRQKLSRTLLLLSGVSLAIVVTHAGPAQAADFSVEINQSRAVHLAAPASTLLVGNPAIADVNVEGAKLLYVLGKAYGRTNIIALDDKGRQIAQFNVNVIGQQTSSVTLMRGAGQVSYNCTPRCERTVNPSDAPEAFAPALNQANQAAGRGLAPSGGGGR